MILNFWDNFDRLPQELVDIIWDFVDLNTKIFVCKSYYLNYHFKIPENLNIKFDCYLRNLIKFDCHFIFSLVLNEEKERIIKINKKNFSYRNSRYNNYLDYLKNLIYEYQANKSQKIFLEWIHNNKDICKNSFKKKKRDNKWTN